MSINLLGTSTLQVQGLFHTMYEIGFAIFRNIIGMQYSSTMYEISFAIFRNIGMQCSRVHDMLLEKLACCALEI